MLHRDNRALSAWQVSPKTGLKLREVAAIDRVGLGSHRTCLRQTPHPSSMPVTLGDLVTLSSQAPRVRTERSWSTKAMAE